MSPPKLVHAAGAQPRPAFLLAH